eukprot:scaffold38147_cov263-Skeletonema_marinoi.AAC.1
MRRYFQSHGHFSRQNRCGLMIGSSPEQCPFYIPVNDAIQRVELIVTDADPQETSAIANHIGGNLKPSAAELRLFINAFHRWCAWHRINRNFTQDSKYKSLLTKIKNSCVLSRIEVDVLERWL